MNDIDIWHWTPGGMRLGRDGGEDHYILEDEAQRLLDQAQCQNELLRKRIAEQATDWKRDDLLPALLRRQAE